MKRRITTVADCKKRIDFLLNVEVRDLPAVQTKEVGLSEAPLKMKNVADSSVDCSEILEPPQKKAHLDLDIVANPLPPTTMVSDGQLPPSDSLDAASAGRASTQSTCVYSSGLFEVRLPRILAPLDLVEDVRRLILERTDPNKVEGFISLSQSELMKHLLGGAVGYLQDLFKYNEIARDFEKKNPLLHANVIAEIESSEQTIRELAEGTEKYWRAAERFEAEVKRSKEKFLKIQGEINNLLEKYKEKFRAQDDQIKSLEREKQSLRVIIENMKTEISNAYAELQQSVGLSNEFAFAELQQSLSFSNEFAELQQSFKCVENYLEIGRNTNGGEHEDSLQENQNAAKYNARN